jgi:GT2 family glycosyltransferase
LNQKLVTVVIVNWNGKRYLKDCLNSLEQQSNRAFDTIVVDNGSNDGSAQFLQQNYPNIKVIALDRNIGYSVGINLGIQNAQSKYLIALNNDTKVHSNWLEELLKMAESNSHIGSCQPKIMSIQNPQLIDSVGLAIKKNGEAYQIGFQEKDHGQYDKFTELLGACSASVLYRREALMQIGGFDADFFAYFEDVDIALRLNKAGWKCMFVPTSIVYHYGSATAVNESPFKTYLLTRNQYFYRIKNQSAGLTLQFLLERPKDISKNALPLIKKRQFGVFTSMVKGNIDGLKSFSKMYHKRSAVL